nr:Zgc:174674 protein [Danio rerio]
MNTLESPLAVLVLKSHQGTAKKEESARKDRLRNKDRPAIQLYQPGSRNRTRGGGGGGGTGGDGPAAEKRAEREAKKNQEKAAE